MAQSTTRRRLFGSAAAIAATATVPAAAIAGAAGPQQDAELLAACAAFWELDRAIQAASAVETPDGAPLDHPLVLAPEEGVADANDDRDETLEAIAAIPARSIAGAGAQAAVMLRVIESVHMLDHHAGAIEERCLLSFLRHLAELGAQGDASRRYGAAGVPNPDTEIVAECYSLEELHHHLEAAFENDDSPGQPSEAHLILREREVWQRLISSTATTRAGQAAKARAARLMSQRELDGTIPFSGFDTDLAYSALADLAGVPSADTWPLPPKRALA